MEREDFGHCTGGFPAQWVHITDAYRITDILSFGLQTGRKQTEKLGQWTEEMDYWWSGLAPDMRSAEFYDEYALKREEYWDARTRGGRLPMGLPTVLPLAPAGIGLSPAAILR